MMLNNLMASQHFGYLGNVEYPFITIVPRSTLIGVVAPDKILSMGKIEQTVCKQMTDIGT